MTDPLPIKYDATHARIPPPTAQMLEEAGRAAIAIFDQYFGACIDGANEDMLRGCWWEMGRAMYAVMVKHGGGKPVAFGVPDVLLGGTEPHTKAKPKGGG